jgi:hypothetical protein
MKPDEATVHDTIGGFTRKAIPKAYQLLSRASPAPRVRFIIIWAWLFIKLVYARAKNI